MSKHNYSQYSNNKKNDRNHENTNYAAPNKPKVNYNKPKVEVTDAVEPAEFKMVDEQENIAVVEPVIMHETVETVTLPNVVTGVIANCNKLNIRVNPSMDAAVATILDSKSEIVINTAESDNEWLKVTTASGVEGYCMRKFVDVKA